ncbi:Hypothetical protein HDN1F_19500 [gamma proteobacterium HdN1]|nr:Hypothetical protein HDN1F_19500 [gamma proteobacterium HdN1]
MVNLDKMLELCRTRQWKIEDLDWTVKPRPLSREEEIMIVQFFTDMSGIERLAGALFAEQERRAETPILREIFASFVVDEERHAIAAEKLANHYNVHQYKTYELSKDLQKFRPHFLNAVRHVSPEIANAYITAGELMLDIALLRSLNDFVNDDMSHQVMDLINRDEARHVAMDYHMTEYYASAAYQAKVRAEPSPSILDRARASWYVGNMFYHARPFMMAVFLAPMEIVDPQGERLREAIKRMQLLTAKPDVAKRPLARFMNGVRTLHNTPVIGDLFGNVLSRIVGAPSEFLVNLYSEEEAQRARQMSMEQLADEALAAKYTGAHHDDVPVKAATLGKSKGKAATERSSANLGVSGA